MYNILKEGQTPGNPEASGGPHPEDLHHVLSEKIPGYGPFHHHQLI